MNALQAGWKAEMDRTVADGSWDFTGCDHIFDAMVHTLTIEGVLHENACSLAREWGKLETYVFFINGLAQGGQDWFRNCLEYPKFSRIPNASRPSSDISADVHACCNAD